MENSYSRYYESSKLFHGCLPEVMGTQLDILFIGLSSEEATYVWEKIIWEVRRLYAMLNKFDLSSELSKINKNAYASPVSVSTELLKILVDCKSYHEKTKGYFDITLSDFNDVRLDSTYSVVGFSRPDITIDVGGYGKGYALEKIRSLFSMYQITQAFVNFGNSSILALGAHPQGGYWPIGIAHPYFLEESLDSFQLNNMTLSVSGNSEQRSNHIFNPFTNLPFRGEKIVSVVAPNAIEAEVLSTTLLVCEEDDITDIISCFEIESYTFYPVKRKELVVK